MVERTDSVTFLKYRWAFLFYKTKRGGNSSSADANGHGTNAVNAQHSSHAQHRSQYEPEP